MKDLLIYGIGNEARQDDGLGHQFIINIPKSDHYDRLHCYQLNIEDAELISHYKNVIFVDAAKNLNQNFEVRKINPKPETGFSTHGLSIEGIMAMTQELYNKTPEVSLLAIHGHKFELKIGLSSQAENNLKQSIQWFKTKYHRKSSGTS